MSTQAHPLSEVPILGSSQSAVILALAISVVITLAIRLSPSSSKGGVYDLGGIPILAAWPFFTKRYDFLRNHFASGKRYFQFHVLQHRVVAISGEEARKMFFNEKGLGLDEGYRILMGGAPNIDDISVQPKEGRVKDAELVKRMAVLFRKDRVVEVLPVLFDDVHRRMNDWGNEGTINPFKELYDLVFQMTVRMGACRELADDKDAIERLTQHYWNIEKNATPTVLLLPWLPSPAKKTQEKATRELFTMLYNYVYLRRNAPTPSTDPIDLLVAYGDSNEAIVSVVMSIIFAGVINTGAGSCWILLHLASHPQWKDKVINELKALVANHTNGTSKEPLHKQLAAIPLHAWEEELPALELVIRETVRLTMSMTSLRRNLGKDIPLADTIIKKGDFLAYCNGDAHMNPNIYTDPEKFDPERYSEGREEDRKETFAYLAWGVGRHPCVGVRIAKMEMKLLTALILLGYEYELVDGAGNRLEKVPLQDRNDIQQARPLSPCYLKFKRVME